MKPEIIGKKYDKIADWWNEDMKNSTYGMAQIEKAIRYCKHNDKALDVGCGTGGRVINRLIERGFTVTALDVSEKMLSIARSAHPDVVFESCDIRTWERNEKYDLIVAWDSIFHLPTVDQEPVIKKLCDLLEDEGIVIYTFGDAYGDHEDLSCRDENGNQVGELDNDPFGYGTIGISENLRVISENGGKCMHLELDQYPNGHVYCIAKKTSAV